MEDPANMFGGIPSPNITVPAMGGGINVNTDVNTDMNINVDTNINTDTPKMHKPTTSGIADTVTSTAGKAAGVATGSAVGWFARTFGR
jgi:hypothetical protein